MAGSWIYTSKYWESEGAKPESSNGTAKLKMILGGRFMENDIKGKAMEMPFEGMGITGYNNVMGKIREYRAEWKWSLKERHSSVQFVC